MTINTNEPKWAQQPRTNSPLAKRLGIAVGVAWVGILGMGYFMSSPRKSAEPVSMAFDIPPMLGKTDQQLVGLLGQPTEQNKGDLNSSDPIIADDDMEWRKDRKTLDVYFNHTSHLVTEILLTCDFNSSDDLPTDQQDILTSGNLQDSDPHYTLEFVPDLYHGQATGHWHGVHVRPLSNP